MTDSFQPAASPTPREAVHERLSTLSRSALFILGGSIVLALAALAFWYQPSVSTSAAGAQSEPLKIGILQNVAHLDTVVDGFKEGMTELGYTNVTYDYQNANGDTKKAAEIAQQFADEGVDMILAVTPPAITIAWQTLHDMGKDQQIPIIFTNGNGLVQSGFFPGFKSSGKNMTGLVPDDVPVTLKKLEFMKEIQPDAKKVAVFFGTGPGTHPAAQAVSALEERAPELGLELVKFPIPGTAEDSPALMQAAADSVQPGDIDAIITVPDPVSNYADNPTILIKLSKRVKAPIYFLTVPRVYEGGLLSYSQDYPDSGKQAAALADKVLQGTPAIDIPLQTSSKNLLIINQETAQEMGLTIPDDLLFVANEVIPAATSTQQ